MKNLKKVLALVMAFACAFTMFAGAAITDFSDYADIKNQDAVSMLSALSVIQGYSDGTFAPNGTITRAEMAKMIFTIASGGNDDASIYTDVSTTFTDVNGHWAAGYIKYCQTNGIIAGKSSTAFVPDGEVSVVETAKMALVVLGYRADKAGLTGTNWQNNVLALAGTNKLLDGVSTSVNSSATRDDAAQILYNLLDADVVVWSNDKEEFVKDTYTTGVDGKNVTTNRTVGEKYLGLMKTIGVLTAVEKTDGYNYYELTIDEDTIDYDDSTGDFLDYFTKVTTDYSSYKLQQVRVLYKSKTEVYGVYPTNNNTTLSGVLGNFEKDSTKLKYNSTKYTADGSVKVDGDTVSNDILTFVDTYTTTSYDTYKAGYIAKAYDAIAVSSSDSAKINLMNVESFAVAQVTNVSSSYINVSVKVNHTGETISTKLEDSDATWYSDIAKDDYVAITPGSNTTDGNWGIEELSLVSGKITTLKNSEDDDLKATIGGTVYELAMDKNSSGNFYGNLQLSLKNNVKVVVKDGYIVYIDDNKAVSDDIALVIETGKSGGLGNTYIADLLLPDGTRISDAEIKSINDETAASYYAANSAGTPAHAYITEPVLASYTKSSGKYELTIVKATGDTEADGAVVGYDVYEEVASNNVKSNKLKSGTVNYIEDTATVYVRYTTGSGTSEETKYAVKTGSDLKGWSEGAKFESYTLANNSNGIPYANVVFADRGDSGLPGGANVTYGYILEASDTTKDGENYTEYKVWNGTEEVDLLIEGTTSNPLAEGTVVQYTVNSDGVANFDETIKKGEWDDLGAVVGYGTGIADMDGRIRIQTDATTIVNLDIDYDDDDSYVLFIDTEEGEGSGATTPTIAQETSDGTQYIANVVYKNLGTTDDPQWVVVVDTQNSIKANLFVSGDKTVYINK